MTTTEFIKEFQQQAAFIDKFKSIRILTDDIQYFLNEGQDVIIKRKLTSFSDTLKKGQRNLDEIRTIIVGNTVLIKDNGLSTTQKYVWDLPDNYLFLISDKSETSYCNTTFNVQNRLYSSENILDIVNGFHSKPSYKSPISEIIGNKLYVYRDNNLTFDITSVNIDYIRVYDRINLTDGTTSELDQSVHRDIVSLAVNIFLEAVESGRFQTITQKNNITEQI
jgi:hypothetical protein